MLLRNLALLLLLGLMPVAAQTGLAQPKDIILTVSGKIGDRDRQEGKSYNLAGLTEIGTAIITTSSPWISGRARFKGVLLRDLLTRLDASGHSKVIATAIDGYSTEIPAEDIANYDVLLAFEMNGVPLTPRDKGPLWIVYPLDDHPELSSVEVNYRWIWQLKSLEIR
ncbi:molybdopterin-dependent oxidoreductase [Aestuariispira insulae]|uniref:Oxidoreductase molybdopterin-binding domain-containing protein n=1 Tax=Aestuariispira insulae TaxID=1461337 RepID=A0A3D9HYC7_9PROT|nr:molybdopterin-dependent oxidoreductase [Aestuariispira insulae]RED54361.1 hypothetical protein DFP90_1011164 [Aestuariispira insulae]